MKLKTAEFKSWILSLTFYILTIYNSHSQNVVINNGTTFNVTGGIVSLSGDLVNLITEPIPIITAHLFLQEQSSL